jgi:hypothetical protein
MLFACDVMQGGNYCAQRREHMRNWPLKLRPVT